MVSINIEMLERITSEILGFKGYHCLGSICCGLSTLTGNQA